MEHRETTQERAANDRTDGRSCGTGQLVDGEVACGVLQRTNQAAFEPEEQVMLCGSRVEGLDHLNYAQAQSS